MNTVGLPTICSTGWGLGQNGAGDEVVGEKKREEKNLNKRMEVKKRGGDDVSCVGDDSRVKNASKSMT